MPPHPLHSSQLSYQKTHARMCLDPSKSAHFAAYSGDFLRFLEIFSRLVPPPCAWVAAAAPPLLRCRELACTKMIQPTALQTRASCTHAFANVTRPSEPSNSHANTAPHRVNLRTLLHSSMLPHAISRVYGQIYANSGRHRTHKCSKLQMVAPQHTPKHT
jgi:hypothetical protein